MPTIQIRGIDCEIDVEAELREYEWIRPRWTSDKLIAASPFRYDQTPSFFVRLEPYGDYPAGIWSDSGSYDDEWSAGGFVKLLSFLRSETYEETEEYLIGAYGWTPGQSLQMPTPKLRLPRTFAPLPSDLVTQATSRYLLSRGISAETQAMYGVGYGKHRNFTALPWRLPDGKLANVKYRATRGKMFFYERGGWPIRRLVYGMDVVYKRKARIAALCEAEIDALSWTEGTGGEVVGIAVGGVAVTDWQIDAIKRSPIEALILAGDNDKAGEKLNTEVAKRLRGHVRIMKADYKNYKDANEMLQFFENLLYKRIEPGLLLSYGGSSKQPSYRLAHDDQSATDTYSE